MEEAEEAVLLREGTVGTEMGTDRREMRPLWGVEG